MKSKSLSSLRLTVQGRANNNSSQQACHRTVGGEPTVNVVNYPSPGTIFFKSLSFFLLLLCASCSVSEQTDRTGSPIRARATTQASATVSRAATDANGMQALVLASQTAGSYATPYARGTMTFGTDAVGYDAEGFEGTQQLPADGSPLHLCALYPAKAHEFNLLDTDWVVADRTASYTFVGVDDVMAAGGQRIEESGAKTASFTFRHLLTRLNFKVYAADADVAKAFGKIGRVMLTKLQGVASFNYQVAVNLADGTADTRTAFSNVDGIVNSWLVWNTATMGDPTYIDFSLTEAVGASNARLVGTTMMAPFIATGSNDLEITADMKSNHTNEKVCSVSFPTVGGADTQGKVYTITLKFTTQGVEATATAEPEWTDNTLTTPGASQNLSEEGTANCYIVTDPDMDFTFDATVRGNGYESTTDPNVAGISYSTLPNLSAATEARVIWQTHDGTKEVISSVRLEDGKVKLMTGSAREGNAMIGVFASSAPTAECLWSWHIWKVNGKLPTTITCTKTLAADGSEVQFEMMDRNLGAYNNTPGSVGSIGLLYQWGRKDPFPGPADFTGDGWTAGTEPTNIYGSYNDGSTTGTWSGTYAVKTKVIDGTVGTEGWAVKHPTIFITKGSSSSAYNWITPAKPSLWGTPWISDGAGGYLNRNDYNVNNGTKSIYDPCPVGYRVPPQDTWSKVVSGNVTWHDNGASMSDFNGAWFSMLIGRNCGDYSDQGFLKASRGFYWHASHDKMGASGGDYASVMALNGGSFRSKSESFPGDGLSIRCVSE